MFDRPNIRDPEYKIAKARSDLITTQPFFGTLALRLQLKETTDVSVMATDGRCLYYNKQTVAKMPQQHVVGVVAHEVLHCALQHVFRRRHRNHNKWNKATDYVINSILLKERFSLPESRLFSNKYTNMSAEEVYERLPNEPPGNGPGGNSSDWDFGSCLDPSSPNEDGKAPSTAEIQQRAKDWELATREAALVAKKAGRLPGNLATLVEDTLKPQIPWREQLWGFLNKSRPGRITWNRPNRRLLRISTADGQTIPMSLPSRTIEPTGDIVIAVDTSGSISELELRHFASEINQIHKTIQPESTYVVYCDTRVAGVDKFSEYDDIRIEARGGGGTSFDPVFDWIEKEQIDLDALVYLTDGYPCGWPNQIDKYPVLWAITNHQVTPPWGEHLIIDV